MKKIGLMGCGTVADYGHIPTILQTPGLQLVALFDPDAKRLQTARDKFGIPAAFTDVDEFLTSGLDAVTITSPAPCHILNVRDALRHGKHVLCEKPLGMTAEECAEMADLARAADRMLFTAFDYRFSPASLKIRELVRNGDIGEVRSLRLIYIWNNHGKFQKDANGNLVPNERRVGRMLEGGPMVDCGVHQIDLARFWLGSEVRDWQAAGAWVDEFDAPDHMYLHMDHDNGAHTMVEISYSYCYTAKEPINQFVYELIGTGGVIRYDRGAKLFEMRTATGTTPLPFSPEKNFAGMYQAFAEALVTGHSDTLPTAEDGLVAARISRTATDQLVANHREASRTEP
jgi:predicted dehydrogenase